MKILLFDCQELGLLFEEAWQEAAERLPGTLNPDLVGAVEQMVKARPDGFLFWQAWERLYHALWLVEIDGVKYHVEELPGSEQSWLVAEGHTLYLD